jgi:hypothetical protein
MTNLPLELKDDILLEAMPYFDEDEDLYEDDYPEVEMIEIPVVRKMAFQFKKPVELDFS